MNQPTLGRAGKPQRHPGETGSAYLFALFVLFVLSVIGLSLALITQTEVQIGGAERQATRIFYGADSGLRIQLANHLVNGDVEAHTRAQGNPIVLDDRTIAGSRVREFIEVSPFYPIFSGVCNLCMVNQDANYHAINHALTATASRVGTLSGADTEQGRKTVAQMFALQPWEQTIAALQQAGDLSTIQY